MSENYSKEMKDIVTRVGILNSVLFNESIFNPNEVSALRTKANSSVVDHLDSINSDLDLAMSMTGNIDNKSARESRIVQSILSKQIETSYGVKTDFMERDQNKQVTVYETFTNDYFSRMFGNQGYRRIFTGDYNGFLQDFKNYGATDSEIVEFNRAIANSVDTGEYNHEDYISTSYLCKKVEKGRILFEKVSNLRELVDSMDENIATKKTL